MVKNIIFNTQPYVVHSPVENPVWPKVCHQFFNREPIFCELNKDLTIVTWNNKQKQGTLEQSLDFWQYPYTVLGREVSQWVNKIKIELTRNFLTSVKTKYVLGIDSFDAIVVRPLTDIIENFERTKAKLLFNATVVDYPFVQKLSDYQSGLFGPQSIYRFLNAGAWIGKTDFCRYFFDEVVTMESEVAKLPNDPYYEVSEQLRVKFAFFKNYPSATIDCRCDIFQILHSAKHYPEEFQENLGINYNIEDV